MTFERKNKAKRTLLTIVLLAFFGMTSSHALEMPFPTKDKPFAVKDSGVEVPHEYGGPVKWMDNDRVIFSAYRKDVPKSIAPEGLRIVIWDTVKNTVTPYAIGKLRCYSDGRIVYLTEPEVITQGKTVPKQKSGEMGSEQFVDLKANEVAGLLNPYSCNSYSSLGYKTHEEVNLSQLHGNILRLHEDHGYLDLYYRRKWVQTDLHTIRDVSGLPFVPTNKYKIKYYRPGQPPIELGIVKGGITNWLVFSKFANAYVLDQLIPDRRSVEASQPLRFPDGPPSVHMLSPDGELTTINYPYSLYNDSNRRSDRINITKLGLVIGMSTQSFRPMLVDTGMLLVRGEKVIKIMDGQVPDFDVSPDGCKVVFPHGELSNGSYPFTIKMINVCDSTHE